MHSGPMSMIVGLLGVQRVPGTAPPGGVDDGISGGVDGSVDSGVDGGAEGGVDGCVAMCGGECVGARKAGSKTRAELGSGGAMGGKSKPGEVAIGL